MLIICTGKLANTTVGHTDHAMVYAAGFQKLGHEVYVMDRVGSGRCIDENGQRVPFEQWQGGPHFEQIARSYGLWPRCCLIYKEGQATRGMSFGEAVGVARRCDLLLTRSGEIHRVPEVFESARRRAYCDGNPGATQVLAQQNGTFDALDRYEVLFTLGLNIGSETCPIPTDGRQWHPMPRPVFLPTWPMAIDAGCRRFTTVSSWKGRRTFQWHGTDSGEKSDNWLQFLDLPAMTGQEFEIALRIDSARHDADRRVFHDKGWRLANPGTLRQLDDYRDFIGNSRAEFSVAHNRYVQFRTGWFSDRTALYLAAGKPALVQSTGLEAHLPTGKGLLTFATVAEAAAGVEEINRDYLGHCRAARAIAERHFDSDKVLGKILEVSCR